MSSSDPSPSLEYFDKDTGDYSEEEFKDALRVIKDVLIDRDNLFNQVAADYVGETLTLQLGECFAVDAERALRWPKGAKAIRATIQHHMGQVLTRKLLMRICWQISANDLMLQSGLPLSPQVEDYSGRWMIVDIARVDADPRVGFATLSFRALNGKAAGWSLIQEISERGAYYIAGRLGFRGRKRFPWYQFDGDVFKLYGLYFAAYLEEGRVTRFACTDPLWTLNRRIIRMRYRGDVGEDGVLRDEWGEPVQADKLPFGCPLLYKHECIDCPMKRHIVTGSTKHKPYVADQTCGAAY